MFCHRKRNLLREIGFVVPILPLGGFDLSLVIIFAIRYKYRTRATGCYVIFPVLWVCVCASQRRLVQFQLILSTLPVSYFTTFPSKSSFIKTIISWQLLWSSESIISKNIFISYMLFEYIRKNIFLT